MKVIGVVSDKGGVGKTTVAVNLALGLHCLQKNAVLVDCNVTTPNVHYHLGSAPTTVTLSDVLLGTAKVEDAVYQHETSLAVIPSAIAANKLGKMKLNNLGKVFNSLKSNFGIVVADGAACLGDEALFLMKYSDEVVLVTTPDMPAVKDVQQTLEAARKLKVQPLGIILNKVHNKKHELTVREVESIVDLPVIAEIPYDIKVKKAVFEGMPVIQHSPRSKASLELKDLARMLSGGERQTTWWDKVLGVFG